MSSQSDPKSEQPTVNGTSSVEQNIRPHTPAPGDSTARTELTKTQLQSQKPNMVSQSVNKTALHPGGVQ